ncbi:aminotransferase class III-fold pyridoxal phosphate-dependent enzyme [Lutimaribacter marinistellae]|uniref:Aminotransferase class III-fold pyridoxal phosphate-dependent enzyme n=1 Tax=Lutimaribacter marinistellae TaxID=1820329 RepID=A0ABV7TH87_9RHOB
MTDLAEHWSSTLRRVWGIDAELTRLDGEYDLNFKADAANGNSYVFKVMRPGCPQGLVEMQVAALAHLRDAAPGLPFPDVIPTLDDKTLPALADDTGTERLCWLQEALPGRCYAKSFPKNQNLIAKLGRVLGATDRALERFEHADLERDFKWDLTRAGWIAEHVATIQGFERQALIQEIISDFKKVEAKLAALPRQAIHNDANDYNILVEGELGDPRRISGLIDLGDMCAAPRICELAIAGAYVVLDHPKPEQALAALVRGYHSANRLSTEEIDLIWPLLRMRLAVSVVNSTLMATETPDDPYVTISQAPAWRFLENPAVNGALMSPRLRAACSLPVTDGAQRVLDWIEEHRGSFAPLMGEPLDDAPMGSLSVENSTWPQNPFDLQLDEAGRIGEEYGEGIWLGYWNEPRLIYAEKGFRKGPWKASDRRTVHIAVDVFAPAGTPLYAPLSGRVEVVENRDNHLDYGGVVILHHETPQGDVFYTLYGHLDPEACDRLKPGDPVAQGAAFCKLGDKYQNGGWVPHVHFQLALTTAGMQANWPGVADPDELELWHAICPNPAALLNLPDSKTRYEPVDRRKVLEQRLNHFAPNLSLTYDEPVMLLRGWKHHLFDEWGRPYLDAYNNVPHVGHAHPRIQAVAADQLKRMNSNTRYLHPAQVAFAEKILSKLPDHLEVCYFVNSGTEANELALRLARAHTGAKGMVTPDHGYHGNTTGVIDISAYKFNAPGGVGQSDWVELVEVADDYRGSFGRDDPERAQKFADLVDPAISALKSKGHGVAGFIAETFPSVGGQIIPPKGYLPAVYEKIRAAGGICIADEVQTGLGRLGDHYFGFEHQGASPDIVVLGKPIGNGHPLGVLVTTRAIAESFAKGPEFFSTFGGSTLSCRIGKEVLDIVDEEELQDNARQMGARLMAGLRDLERDFTCLGDVRGMGLFIGVELVAPDGSESTEICRYVKNRMRDHRILIGSEGPHDNILKIRPPLTIEAEDVDMILHVLRAVLTEVGDAPPAPAHDHCQAHGAGCGCC